MAARRRDQETAQPGSRADAYTGMLVISLLATLTGLAFLWLDYSQYPDKAPKVSLPAGPR